MSINIKATNIELTDAIRNYVNNKLKGIEKFVKKDEISSYIEVGKTTNHHRKGDFFKAEFNMEISGSKFYAVSEQEDLYRAIDETKADIIRQVTSKKKREKKIGRASCRERV